MTPLFYLAIMLLGGLLFARLVKLIKLPNVTGYIICGLIIGPYVLKIIPENTVSSFSIFSDVALGFIAFTIGCEFKGTYLKRVGIAPVVIAIFEALLAVVLVTIGLYIYTKNLAFSIVLGSIAAATAPAATILIIRQYKAKGAMTDTLMSVVALDDAVAIIGFGIAVAVANVLQSTNTSVLLNILQPFHEIFSSLIIGVAIGFIFMLPLKMFKKQTNRTCLVIAFVFLTVAIASIVGGSSLLACMAFGCAYINIDKRGFEIQEIVDMITPPIFVIFFVESGASLDIGMITSIGVIGVIYIILRVVGKYGGSYLSCQLMHSPKNVKNYLGLALIPQAGVAIGLSIVCQSTFPQYSAQITAVVLCATLIYEIIGPVLSKIALTKAGDIVITKKTKKVSEISK